MSILRSIKIDAPKEFINPRLQLVSGKTISETYRNTHDATVGSCMKGSRTTVYERILGLKMLRVTALKVGQKWVRGTNLRDYYIGKYIDLPPTEAVFLRALVWTVTNAAGEKRVYIDRVYSSQTWAHNAFKKHWKQFADIRYNHHTLYNYPMMAKLKEPYKNGNAYLDTFRFFNNTKKLVSNVRKPEWKGDSVYSPNDL